MPDVAVPAKPMVKIDEGLLKLIGDINVLRDEAVEGIEPDEWEIHARVTSDNKVCWQLYHDEKHGDGDPVEVYLIPCEDGALLVCDYGDTSGRVWQSHAHKDNN